MSNILTPSTTLGHWTLWSVVTERKSTLNSTFCSNTNDSMKEKYQRTNGPVNAHLISWPSKAQDIQNLENIW